MVIGSAPELASDLQSSGQGLDPMLGVALTQAQLGRRRGGGLLFSDQFSREHPQQARELTRQVLGRRPPTLAVAAHLLASVYHDTVFRLPRMAAPTW